MEDRNQRITRQSASHDAAQGIVNALIQRNDFFEGETKEELREEIKEELKYWTSEFKYHARSGRWMTEHRDDVVAMIKKREDMTHREMAEEALEDLRRTRPEVIDALSGEQIEELKQDLIRRYDKQDL